MRKKREYIIDGEGKRRIDKRTPYRKAMDRAEEAEAELLHEVSRNKEMQERLDAITAQFDQYRRDTEASAEAVFASNQRLHAKLHAKSAALTRARCMIAELIDEGQLPR